MQLRVDRASAPDGTVLTVHGDLDVATVATLRAAVASALEAVPERLYLDLAPATFIDSTGCRELVRSARGGATTGTRVEVVAPPSNWRVRRVIDFIQLGALLPVHDEAPWA